MLDPLNGVGDRAGARLARRRQRDARRPDSATPTAQFCELGWNGLAQEPGLRRAGHAAARRRGGRRNVERVEHGVRALPDADQRRDRGDRAQRLRRAEANLSAEDGRRRMDRHDEPDRAAGRIGPRRRAHEGRAAGATAATASTATRSSSPTASTTTPTTSSTSCSRARPTRRRARKGISLFVVPKFLVNADGSLGARNDVRCVSLEHKLGIHASPTAVLAFGDHGGAVGYLVGEENRGLEYMFVMMNLARFGVGMQGVGIADRAYQRAVALRARTRAGPRRRRGEGRRAGRHHRPSRRAPDADDDARQHRSGARARLRDRRRARSRASPSRCRDARRASSRSPS